MLVPSHASKWTNPMASQPSIASQNLNQRVLRAPGGINLFRCLHGGNQVNTDIAFEALEMAPNASLKEHVHRDSHSYIIVAEGSARFVLDGVAKPAAKGDQVMVPSGCWHEVVSGEQGCTFYTINTPPILRKGEGKIPDFTFRDGSGLPAH
ncbi:hypothetical protein AAMO2058_001428000 [Amorphochlora amoebiformis]